MFPLPGGDAKEAQNDGGGVGAARQRASVHRRRLEETLSALLTHTEDIIYI